MHLLPTISSSRHASVSKMLSFIFTILTLILVCKIELMYIGEHAIFAINLIVIVRDKQKQKQKQNKTKQNKTKQNKTKQI